jgi:DNA-directed RNA polymerase specialized sigma24 family protein
LTGAGGRGDDRFLSEVPATRWRRPITWRRFTENVSRLRDPDRVGAWLATTARNESLKVIRLGARVTATDSPQVLDRASEEGSPETAVLAAEEDADRLRRARHSGRPSSS